MPESVCWTAQDVADRFREAVITLRRLPPVKVQGYFNLWSAIHTSEEVAAMEPRPLRITPSPAAISRLEETMFWVLWIEEEERRLIWARAARVPWKRLCWQLGCDRTTAWRRWQRALWTIAGRLNAAR